MRWKRPIAIINRMRRRKLSFSVYRYALPDIAHEDIWIQGIGRRSSTVRLNQMYVVVVCVPDSVFWVHQ